MTLFSLKRMWKKRLMIFLLANSVFLCFSQTQIAQVETEYSKTCFSNALFQITRCLEENRINTVENFITDGFLSEITNSANSVTIQQYTQKWIEEYADVFPEAFLIHCMANGDLSIIKDSYSRLTNSISKNSARWALMVNDEPLIDQSICPRQGRFFKSDYELWEAVPALKRDNSITKPFILYRTDPRPLLYMEVTSGVVVERDDNVPVPWGNDIKPHLSSYPYQVSKKDLFSLNRKYKLSVSRSLSTMAFLPSISFTRGCLQSMSDEKIWTFFKQRYSPYICVGGQTISTLNHDEISGDFFIIFRSLLGKNLSTKRLDFNNSEQDLVISLPMRFSLTSKEEALQVKVYNVGPLVSEKIYFQQSGPSYNKFRKIKYHRFVKKGACYFLTIFLLWWLIGYALHKKADSNSLKKVIGIVSGVMTICLLCFAIYMFVSRTGVEISKVIGGALLLPVLGNLFFQCSSRKHLRRLRYVYAACFLYGLFIYILFSYIILQSQTYWLYFSIILIILFVLYLRSFRWQDRERVIAPR